MVDSPKNWMSGAVKHPGAFTKKAKAHGMSVHKYADEVKSGKEKTSTQTKRQASLAQTFEKLGGRGK
jgi:hypothetical protein